MVESTNQQKKPLQPDPLELGVAPRRVRLRRWWPIWISGAISVFILPHTALAIILGYSALSSMICSLTGLSLPRVEMEPPGPAQILFIFVAAAFANAVVATFWWALWHRHVLHRRLVVSGTLAIGNVIGKRTFTVGAIAHGTAFAIDFVHAAGSGAMHVNESAFDALSVGDPVTILYDPTRPGSAIMYNDDCEYRVRIPRQVSKPAGSGIVNAN